MDLFHNRLKKMLPVLRSMDARLIELAARGQEMDARLNDLAARGQEMASYLGRIVGEGEMRTLDALEEHRRNLAAAMPDNPASKGWKAFSQNDEDGVVQECLRRMESLSHTFIEFCCGDGLENNTHLLLLRGFRGVWLDGAQANIDRIQVGLGSLKFDKLWVRKNFLTLDNLAELVQSSLDFLAVDNVDVFSLDVDGNDIYFAERIQEMVRPKLMIVEYNGKFPPPLSVTIAYNPEHIWQGDDFHGASLQKFVDVLDNYTLVACNVVGANAFFVRKDLMGGFTEYPVELLYQPLRLKWAGYPVYHPASFKWAKQMLKRMD